MAFEELMGLANRLLVDAQALAALTARLRLEELGEPGDPEVREALDRVVDALGVGEALDALEPRERAVITSFARSYLRQALDLVEEPARAGAWSFDDPALLRSQGAASAVVARLIADAGLGKDDARILDVGTGVAGLAIAFCETFPRSTVVGIDPWEPALAIARENVAAAGLERRITILATRVEELADADGFDLVWLPTFFVPGAALDGALERVAAVTRPGGTVVLGAPFGAEDDALGGAVDDLFTVRSGGSIVAPADGIERLQRVGFDDARELERTWRAPLRLVAGRRA